MTSLDVGIARLRSAAIRVSDGWTRFTRVFKSFMPKGLYARSLLIIIAPMVILQSVVAFVFMERHWNLVTRHLSAAVVGGRPCQGVTHLVCSIDTLAGGSQSTIRVDVLASRAGLLAAAVRVSSATLDEMQSNNAVSLATTVV